VQCLGFPITGCHVRRLSTLRSVTHLPEAGAAAARIRVPAHSTLCLRGPHRTKQAVLIGPGLDTRAARVDWPGGTLVMELVPAAAAAATGHLTLPRHAQGSRALQRLYSLLPLSACDELHPEHTWMGELLYAKDVELELQQLLTTNGFRGDRPSVWTLQARAGSACTRVRQRSTGSVSVSMSVSVSETVREW
jgi:hypothetical protein